MGDYFFYCTCDFVYLFFVALGLELKAYTSRHSTSAFFVKEFSR
jgi:hypothetical protein